MLRLKSTSRASCQRTSSWSCHCFCLRVVMLVASSEHCRRVCSFATLYCSLLRLAVARGMVEVRHLQGKTAIDAPSRRHYPRQNESVKTRFSWTGAQVRRRISGKGRSYSDIETSAAANNAMPKLILIVCKIPSRDFAGGVCLQKRTGCRYKAHVVIGLTPTDLLSLQQ